MRQFVLDEELDTNISNFQLIHDDLYLTSNCSFQKRVIFFFDQYFNSSKNILGETMLNWFELNEIIGFVFG